MIDPLGAYVEYIGVISSDPDANYRAIFSVGLTCPLGANLVLDVGTRVALHKASNDIPLFAGMTVRY